MANMDSVSSPQAPSLPHRLGWLAFALLACAHFSLLCFWRSPEFLNLQQYANYGERLPYQGRILMAWVLHVTAGNPRLGPKIAHIAAHAPRELHDPYIFVLLIVTFVSMFIALLAARATLLALTGDRRFASWGSLLTLYMAYFNLLTIYGLIYILPYDVTSLALFSVGVWLVLTRRYWLLLPVFVIGTLNRETYCFITIFMVLYAWFQAERQPQPAKARMDALRRLAPHVVLQTVLWLGVRLWLRHLFLHNPQDTAHGNGLFAFQLAQNVKSLVKPAQWPLFLSLFGFTLPLFFWGYRWIGDRALARSVAVLLGVWAVAMIVVGIVVEIRIFDELTAFLAPAIALILWNRWVKPASGATLPEQA